MPERSRRHRQFDDIPFGVLRQFAPRMASRIFSNTVGFCARSKPAVRTVLSFMALNRSISGRQSPELRYFGHSRRLEARDNQAPFALIGIAVMKKRRPFGQLDARFAMQLDGAQAQCRSRWFPPVAHTEKAKRPPPRSTRCASTEPFPAGQDGGCRNSSPRRRTNHCRSGSCSASPSRNSMPDAAARA